MAITDPNAVRFVSDHLRPMADKLASTYYEAHEVLNLWNATQMGLEFPVDGGDVEDGAHDDGRTVINGNDVQLMMARVQELVTDMEANNNAKLNTVLKPSVNVD